VQIFLHHLSPASAFLNQNGYTVKSIVFHINVFKGKFRLPLDFYMKISYIVNWQYDMYKLSKTVEI